MTQPNKPRWSQRWLLRGESLMASTGLILAAILLGCMGGTAYWTLRTQQAKIEVRDAQEMRSLGTLLSETVAVMLSQGELSTVRRLLTEAGRHYDFVECTLVLPDGQVIADSDPSKITLLTLPPAWSGAAADQEAHQRGEEALSWTYPVSVHGHGVARLDITRAARDRFWWYWEVQAGVGAIGAVALIAMLLVYRHTRARLLPLGIIRESLFALSAGERTLTALAVDGDFGPEAEAWNRLLAEKGKLEKQSLDARVQKALVSQPSANRQLQEMCDAMRHGVILVDENVRATYANGAAAVYIGTDPQKIMGSGIVDIALDQRITEAVEAAVSGAGGSSTSVELDQRGADGGGVLRFGVRPLRREDSSAAMITIEDVTQQRVADEARNAFITQVTHELRAPLTNIRLSAEMAIEDGEEAPAVRAKCLNVINQEAKRLERVVSDMLSVAEMEAGTLELRHDDVRPDALFEELEAHCASLAREKDVTLKFNLPPKFPVMTADRDKIALVLHNLVNNAIKYSRQGGQVVVNVEVEDDTLLVDVIDNGIGISEDDVDRVFERFYRAKDPRVANETGSGLGLALALQVVRLHGGDIRVESKINKGSTFSVTLPVAAKAA